MTKRKNSSENEQVNNEWQKPEEAKQGEVSLAEILCKLDGIANLVADQRERINKLELKIDAGEKLSARTRNYSAEDIFKVQNPFGK